MKTKIYKLGSKSYKAYFKPVGKGFEVGFVQGSKPVFVGNFIKNSEAMAWYQIMNREVSRFSKKFWHNGTAHVATNLFRTIYTNTIMIILISALANTQRPTTASTLVT
jgi:hypothetical protein